VDGKVRVRSKLVSIMEVSTSGSELVSQRFWVKIAIFHRSDKKPCENMRDQGNVRD
jgi:hypothetical protein